MRRLKDILLIIKLFLYFLPLILFVITFFVQMPIYWCCEPSFDVPPLVIETFGEKVGQDYLVVANSGWSKDVLFRFLERHQRDYGFVSLAHDRYKYGDTQEEEYQEYIIDILEDDEDFCELIDYDKALFLYALFNFYPFLVR